MFKQQAKSKQKSERLTDPNKTVPNKQWRTFIDEEKKKDFFLNQLQSN